MNIHCMPEDSVSRYQYRFLLPKNSTGSYYFTQNEEMYIHCMLGDSVSRYHAKRFCLQIKTVQKTVPVFTTLQKTEKKISLYKTKKCTYAAYQKILSQYISTGFYYRKTVPVFITSHKTKKCTYIVCQKILSQDIEPFDVQFELHLSLHAALVVV